MTEFEIARRIEKIRRMPVSAPRKMRLFLSLRRELARRERRLQAQLDAHRDARARGVLGRLLERTRDLRERVGSEVRER